ncbi:MAG: hypothetical protein AMXMBFR33_57950 [Candidatus Xenobia bacterium]
MATSSRQGPRTLKSGENRGIFCKTLKDGRKVWWIRYVGGDGKERQEKAGFSKEAARDLRNMRKTEVLEGRWRPPGLPEAPTITQVVERYAESRKAHVSEKSRGEEQRYQEYRALPRPRSDVSLPTPRQRPGSVRRP